MSNLPEIDSEQLEYGALFDKLESMNMEQKMLENALATAMIENIALKTEIARLKAFLED